jgi:hypothetical protein
LQDVLIDPRCLFALITSSLEVFNRETTGLLIGNQRERRVNGQKKRVIVLEAAYPFQTAKRHPTWVDIGNFTAFERARASLHSLEFPMVGEFHSHPNRPVSLTEADVCYIRERAKEIYQKGNKMLNHHWLEVIISVKRRFYQHPQKVGWSLRMTKKRLTCIIKVNPYVGYRVVIGGFWININNGKKLKHDAKLIFSELKNGMQNN